MADEFKQNEVSKAVWPWMKSKEAVKKPEGILHRLASKGFWMEVVIQVLVGTLIGWFLLYHTFGHRVVPYIIWTIGSIMVFTALFMPAVHARIKRGLLWFGVKVGNGVTWIVLVPFFYLCFLPIRLSMKLKGKDPMERKFDPKATTYWVPRAAIQNMDQYKKQH